MTEPVVTDPRLELRAAKLRNASRRHPGPPADDQSAADDQPAVVHPPLTVGVHHDVPADRYHADRDTLSSSEARQLIPPSCPAKYRWTKDHGRPPTRTFDIGHAAHQMVLGAGEPLEVVNARDWRTKAAQQQQAEARAAGRTPLLAAEHERVLAMADALRSHPTAPALLQPGGRAEVTLVWTDQRTGVNCRARLDYLPAPRAGGRLIVPDYKTTTDASLPASSRSMATYGYHLQAAWYLDGCQQLGLGDDSAAFVFICQEKTPPYVVTVYQPDPIAMRVGLEQALQARHVWQWCTSTGRWPAYTDEVAQLALPRWAELEAGVHA